MTEQVLENLSFEEALVELEATITQLEAGNLTLEASIALFERGQQLTEYCNQLLDNAQLKVEQLTEDGEIIAVSVDLDS
ncbi:MAG: exodeoxyribonuclease VII small subunit [Chloroflexota bacterium]